MKAKSFIGLAIATAVAVIAAVATVYMGRAGDTEAERGQPMVPDLVDQANEISQIAVRGANNEITIEKREQAFVEAASGYPVRTDAVRNLVGSLAILDIEERKTELPERYVDIELAEPGAAEGAGRQLTVKAGDEKLVDLVLGKRDFTVGGTRGGMFVRRAEQPPAYLVRGDVTLPGSRSGWFDTQIVKLEPSDFTGITGSAGDGDSVNLVKSRSTDALILDNLPEGEKADPSRVQRYGQMVSSLTFEDVRKSSGSASGNASITASTKDIRLEIKPVASELKIDDAWVQVVIKPQAVSATGDANALNEKVAGFDFKLRSFDAELLTWKLTDVLSKKQADGQPARPPMPAMPGMPGMPGMGMPGMPGMPPRR